MKNYLPTLKLIVLIIAVGGPRIYADGFDPRKGFTQTRTILNNTNATIYLREIWQNVPEQQIFILNAHTAYQLEVPTHGSQIEVAFYNNFVGTVCADAPAGQTNYYVSGNPWVMSIPKIMYENAMRKSQ